MIDLKRNPDATLKLKQDDIVTIDGQTLTTFVNDDDRIYLTTTTCKGIVEKVQWCDQEEYAEYFHHLRRSDVSNKALMARQEMMEIIQGGGYYIG